jgi:hypothetical protein
MILGHGLPPLVTGDLRGEVEISILLISLINNSFSTVSVSPRWWGSELNVKEINEPRLYPPLSHDDSPNASLAAALIEADSLAKTYITHSHQSMLYPLIADSDATTRYFADASTLTLIIRSENRNAIIGKASVLIGDSLGRGQTSLVGIAHIEEESIIKGSLVYVLRLRTGRESWLLSERSLLESRIPPGEISSFMNAEDYLELLKKRKNEIDGDGKVRIADSEEASVQQSRVTMKDEVKSVLDLDITYPLATSTSHIGAKSDIFHSTALEKCSTSPQCQSNLGTKQIQIYTSPVSPLPNFQSLSIDSNKIDSSKLLYTSFEVAEEVASGDVHNLLPTPSSVFQKRLTTNEREKKAKDFSGGLISRASRGTSPESSSSNLRGMSPSGWLLQNLNTVSSHNSSIGKVSFVSYKNGIQQNSKIASPFAASSPRLDGVNEVIRASEKHKVLNGTDLWSAEYSSTSTLSHREEQDNSDSSKRTENHSQSENIPLTCLKPDSPSTCLKTNSGQDTSTKVTEDPSFWLAGISQPSFSRQPTEHSHENVTIEKTSTCSLAQLLSRSSATLIGIDEALVIGANLGGTSSLLSRATFNAAETSLRANSKDIVASKYEHSDLPISIPSKIAKNLSQSEVIVATYQDITSSLNKGGSSATTSRNLFEKKTSLNPDIMSLPEGTDERTIAIFNETAFLSMGEIAKFDDPVESENIHSSQRVNHPLSSVLQKANVDYSRLKSALSTTESALRLPSLTVLGDRLRSLSQRVNGINVDLSAVILFPAATVVSAHQSSGKFGPIALLAVENEQGNLEKVKIESNQYPRILKQQSAHTLQDWLKGCKVWLEYSIPPCAASKAVRGSQFNNKTCDEVTEPGEAITVSVVAQPIGLSEYSHSLNTASNGGDNIKSGEKFMSYKKSTSPTKPLAMTSSSPRKSLAPPRGSPLRLVNPSRSGGDSTLLPPAQKNDVTSTLSTNAAHLLLASIPHPSLSIPSGYVSDWDQQHSVMTLDSIVHTRENKIKFDDDCLSRWLGNVDEKGFEKGQSLLSADSSSSIVVRLYLDASSHEPSLAPVSKLSSSESARSKKKPASPLLKGETVNATPSFPSSSSTSSPNSQRVLIGEGRLPLRQLLLSDSLSLDATVDVFSAIFSSHNESRKSRASNCEKTLATLKQVREQSAKIAVASLSGPVHDSADVILSCHETFLSSFSLSSEERQRVQRALDMRTAAVENNPNETKRVIGISLSPLLGGKLLKGASDSEVSRNDSKHSSVPIKSEVVARVRMRVCLLQNSLQRIEVEKNTSSVNVLETLRSLPNQASELKKSQSNHSEGCASLPRPSTFHSNLPPSSLHSLLGADRESLRPPASPFIVQSMSDGTDDSHKKILTQAPQNTSSLATKLSQIFMVDTNVGDERIDAGEERDKKNRRRRRGLGASLILSLHKISSISPRGAFTALGGSSVADDNPHSNSSIMSLFVRAQPNRAVFSLPFDKTQINVPSTRQSVCTSPTSLPEFRLNSDVILPLHKPSSTDGAQGLATTLLSSNNSGCVLEVYGLIVSSDDTNECNVNSSSTHEKPRARLFSQEPMLLGTVKVPLEGVADALNLVARSETSLWDGPERVFRYPKVFDIIHPASADGIACGQLSLSMYAAANGRQLLVFTGQSAAALEIQKWWSIVVVKARKNREERERERRVEEEMEKLKAAEDERLRKDNGNGKKVRHRVSVNADFLTSAEEEMMTKNTKAAPSGLTATSRAETHDDQVSNHLKFRSLELSPTQTELSSRTVTELLSSTPSATLSELVPPNKSSELILPSESSKLQSSTINHTQRPLSQNSNPWVIETCISDQMNVMSSQNLKQETQFANSLVDVESALDVYELVPDFFPIDLNSFDANDAFEICDEENVDTAMYFHTHSTDAKIGSSTSDMQGNDHEKGNYISVEEAQVSVTASDDIPFHNIAKSPTNAMKSGHPLTSNLIHSIDKDSKSSKDEVFMKKVTIDAEASCGSNSVHSLGRNCEQIDKKNLETARFSFISEVPRLQIDSLKSNLSETERLSAVLPSSLFGSHHSSKIDINVAKISIDDLLAQLAHERIHEEETVIKGKLKANAIMNINESSVLHLNKSSVRDFVNVKDCAEFLTSNVSDESTSMIDNCVSFVDVGMELPTESHPRLNSTVSDVESQNEVNFELQPFSIVCKPEIPPSPDSEIHRDGILDAVNDFDHQSDTEIYSLDFESVTHAEDACMNDEKKAEDSHCKIKSDNEEDEICKNVDCMDYDNVCIENGGEVIHYDKVYDNTNDILGYVISTDEETHEEDVESEEPTFAYKQLTENRSILNQSKRFSNSHNVGGRNEDDHSNIDEHIDVEDDVEDNRREHSSLDIKKKYFQYRLSEHLDNVNVDEAGQEKSSYYFLSQSGSPISLLELLPYQDELFFKAVYKDYINRVNDDVIYDNISSKVSVLPVVNEKQLGVIGMVGDYVSFNLDQFPPSSTIEQSNSITFSEIEEALALEETSRAQSINNFVTFEEVDMDLPMILTRQDTVSILLGSTFEEELLSAVSVERGNAFAEINIEDDDRIYSKTILMSSSSSFSPSNYVLSDVAGCNDLVAVIDQWVERQRSTLIANIDASIDKDNVSDSRISSTSAEHFEKFNQSSSAIPTDVTNTQLPVTLHVNDRDSYSPERTFELSQIGIRSHLINSDRIVQQGLLHISKIDPGAYDNHARRRQLLGLPSSSTSSSSLQHSDFMSKVTASQSQSSNRDIDVEKKRTPTRLIDVRDTNKLAELLRGVKSR